MKRTSICILSACLWLSLAGCSQNSEIPAAPPVTEAATAAVETVVTEPTAEIPPETEPPESEPTELPEYLADSDFVNVSQYLPNIAVELKYATTDNFTGKIIYDFQEVYLRLGTLRKLQAVQEELQGMGLSLKIWDGFRPVSAQWKLWEAYPDPNYVSHPETGGRTHCRGNTVDVTLVDSRGQELEMPTGFDDFSAKADRNYSDCSDKAAVNAGLLEHIMVKHGFTTIQSEWWHFADCDAYPIEEQYDPTDLQVYYAKCNDYINLREEPDVYAASLLQIPANDSFSVMGWYDRFALVEYQEQRGYVNRDYIAPLK